MTICILTRTLLKGGAEKQSVLLANELSHYYKILLVVLHDSGVNFYKKVLDEDKVKVIFLNGNTIKKIYCLSRILLNEKVKIIFCFLFSTNVVGSIAGKISKVKFIIGGIRNSHHSFFKGQIQKIIHNHFSNYSVLNNYSVKASMILKNYESQKIKVIPNGIAIKLKSICRSESNTLGVVTVARFVRQKDYTTAINSIDYLIKNKLDSCNYKIRYRIVGYGPLRQELQNYISKLGLSDVIEFHEDKDLDDLLTKSDIYLCTSKYEGTSNSILEAMNYSLPIVATNVGDNNLLVHNYKNGILCDVGDYIALGEALHSLIIDKNLRNSMGECSYSLLKKKYSLEIFREKYLEFISSLETKPSFSDADRELYVQSRSYKLSDS